MPMTNLVGTITDSAELPISGTLTVSLSEMFVDQATNPDSILTVKPKPYPITAGVVNISLQSSDKVSYHFNFVDSNNKTYLDFDALVPDGLGNPVQFASLTPTGITSDNLDTGAIRVGQAIVNDPLLSDGIRPVHLCRHQLSAVTTQQVIYIPKPFAGGIKARQLSVLIISGAAGWTFDVGQVKSDGTDETFTAVTPTSVTANGRTKLDFVYNVSRPANSFGLLAKVTPGQSSTALNGTLCLTFSEVPQ